MPPRKRGRVVDDVPKPADEAFVAVETDQAGAQQWRNGIAALWREGTLCDAAVYVEGRELCYGTKSGGRGSRTWLVLERVARSFEVRLHER
jgi:hypothetical protein